VKAVCVYCGSSAGRDPVYLDTAREVGGLLADAGIELVYGGGSVGLMGAVADAALASGGRVTGVIPRGLFRAEVAHPGVTELIEVGSMHERKLAMFERADGFVALPGGLGTLEELTELATWAQLRMHDKPIVTVDVDRFWEPFHLLLRHFVERGFMKAANLGLIVNVGRPADILPAFAAYG
jgi:uncharacterized protein (TIGR00730 family)